VRPAAVHLPGYRKALERGYSPDNIRGLEATREQLEEIEHDAAAFLARMDDPEGTGPPVKMPDGTTRTRIPGLRRWIWLGDDGDENGFVGSIGLRWTRDGAPLPPHVLGHIGYAVVPWQQRRGHGTRALALMLPLAGERGLGAVEITTDPDNHASRRVIEANGGRLVEAFDKGEAYGHVAGVRYMIALAPHVREAGAGAGAGASVVCIHSNASNGGQWRALMERLASQGHGQWHVSAPDSYGSGKSPDWPSARTITLADEVALLEPVLQRAGSPCVLVGHSYGAAVALKAAWMQPQRVRALVLYEPTLFALIEADSPPSNEAEGIREAVALGAAALDAGDADEAARLFIDYWMGAGSWRDTPANRKPAITASVRHIRRWAHALFTEPVAAAPWHTLDMPVLLMTGGRSTAAAHGVARRLAQRLPHAQRLDFAALGHMGPITHPEPVNAAIADFLARLE
jgi:pimeloyl-ACP methyl ester carboxylesterase/predicted acetyltransferase